MMTTLSNNKSVKEVVLQSDETKFVPDLEHLPLINEIDYKDEDVDEEDEEVPMLIDDEFDSIYDHNNALKSNIVDLYKDLHKFKKDLEAFSKKILLKLEDVDENEDGTVEKLNKYKKDVDVMLQFILTFY